MNRRVKSVALPAAPLPAPPLPCVPLYGVRAVRRTLTVTEEAGNLSTHETGATADEQTKAQPKCLTRSPRWGPVMWSTCGEDPRRILQVRPNFSVSIDNVCPLTKELKNLCLFVNFLQFVLSAFIRVTCAAKVSSNQSSTLQLSSCLTAELRRNPFVLKITDFKSF